MRCKVIFTVAALLFLTSCSNYKVLKPVPPITSKEGALIELKKEQKDFEVKKGKKYFIVFPASLAPNFYLVLNLANKDKFSSLLTSTLQKKKKYGEKIKDETYDKVKMSVYPVDKNTPFYYWLVDSIKQDMMLKMQYRYVPQWRFKFENKAAEFKKTLEGNLVDRSTYQSIGVSYHFAGFNYTLAIDTIGKRLANIQEVEKELLAIESIFPSDILNSTDAAYLNYKSLKKNVENEIKFQQDYLAALTFFNTESIVRGKTGRFLDSLETFLSFFGYENRFPDAMVTEGKNLTVRDLEGVVPFYNTLLSEKKDIAPFDTQTCRIKELSQVNKLYGVSGIDAPADFKVLYEFVKIFDERSASGVEVNNKRKAIIATVTQLAEMPSNTFFNDRVQEISELQKLVPQKLGADLGNYQAFPCAERLNQELDGLSGKIKLLVEQYSAAAALVPQLNLLKEQREFRSMIGLLKQNQTLDFLAPYYKDLDKMSVDEQSKGIREALAAGNWPQTEVRLKSLHTDEQFLNLPAISGSKKLVVAELEDSLYNKVDRYSRARIQRFLTERIDSLNNVDSLYADSVFVPAYNITFTTGTRSDLVANKQSLIDNLLEIRDIKFPEQAIKHLYTQFVQNTQDNGVLKARAIVSHSEHYKGKDEKISAMVAECNPAASKWVTKPTEYRRVYALPVTDSKNGENRYFIRLNIRCPSDAAFPVYDVNVKLPKELANNAQTEQWYESLTINGQLLKNEGRFTITAPSSTNNYECQITPVQMKKDQNNYLDIKFKSRAFKVYTMSVMVQKPIIKKN